MLGLEGQLPPILVSLVRKDKMVNEILDDCSLAKEKLEEVKNVLHEHLSREKWGDEMAGMLNPSDSMSVNAALTRMQSEGITPRQNMERLRAAMASLLKNLDRLVTDNKRLIIYDNETIEEMQHRWEKVHRSTAASPSLLLLLVFFLCFFLGAIGIVLGPLFGGVSRAISPLYSTRLAPRTRRVLCFIWWPRAVLCLVAHAVLCLVAPIGCLGAGTEWCVQSGRVIIPILGCRRFLRRRRRRVQRVEDPRHL